MGIFPDEPIMNETKVYLKSYEREMVIYRVRYFDKNDFQVDYIGVRFAGITYTIEPNGYMPMPLSDRYLTEPSLFDNAYAVYEKAMADISEHLNNAVASGLFSAPPTDTDVSLSYISIARHDMTTILVDYVSPVWVKFDTQTFNTHAVLDNKGHSLPFDVQPRMLYLISNARDKIAFLIRDVLLREIESD